MLKIQLVKMGSISNRGRSQFLLSTYAFLVPVCRSTYHSNIGLHVRSGSELGTSTSSVVSSVKEPLTVSNLGALAFECEGGPWVDWRSWVHHLYGCGETLFTPVIISCLVHTDLWELITSSGSGYGRVLSYVWRGAEERNRCRCK